MSIFSSSSEKASLIYTNGVQSAKAVADEMENIATNTAIAIENTANWVDKSIQNIGKKIDKEVDDLGEAIDDNIKKTGIAIDSTIKNIGNKIDNTVNKVGVVIDNTAKSTAKIVDNSIISVATNVNNQVSNIESKLVRTTDIIDKKTGINTGQYVEQLVNVEQQLRKKASDTVKNAYNNVKKVTEGVYDGLSSTTKNSYNDITKATENVYKSVKNEVNDVYSDVKKVVQAKKRAISDTVKEAYQKTKEVVKDEVKKNVIRVKNAYSAIKQAASNVVSGVVTACQFANTGGGTPSPSPIIIPSIGKLANKIGNPCGSISTASTGKTKKERYSARMNVISESKKQLSSMPESPQKKALSDTVERFELNNRAIERAKLVDNIYIKDKDIAVKSGKITEAESKDIVKRQVGQRNDNGTAPEGWNITEESKPGEEPVYQIYKSDFEDPAKSVVVFRGTDNAVNFKKDWQTNGLNGLGVSTEQYRESIKLAQKLKTKLGENNLEIAGHSKAGGQAASASIETGVKGYSFNSAGVNSHVVENSLESANQNNSENKPLVDSFNFPGEVLSTVQDNRIKASALLGSVLGGVAGSVLPVVGTGIGSVAGAVTTPIAVVLGGALPAASGMRHVLPAQDINGNPVDTSLTNAVELHGMKYLINSMEKQKQDDLDNIAKAFGCK